jgi:DNA-binding winged helix-turn-helix (wHTH) protein
MEFLILGPLEVADDGRKLALGGPKQRAVLAHLILRANRVVQADLLIDGLWGEEPPESARNTLQTYVYRLRKLLGENRIEGRDGGYVLVAAPDEIDGVRFESLVKEGKASISPYPGAAAAILADALSLWRADALADVTEEPSLRGEAARAGGASARGHRAPHRRRDRDGGTPRWSRSSSHSRPATHSGSGCGRT